MSVKEARERAISVKSYTVMMQDVDRAITDGQDDGFLKVYVREGSDTIMGATIVAARASEMINEMSVIMSAGIGMRQLASPRTRVFVLHESDRRADNFRRGKWHYPPADTEVTHGSKGIIWIHYSSSYFYYCCSVVVADCIGEWALDGALVLSD